MLPLQFKPLIKRIRWGGTRLETVLGKSILGAHDAAESWEISDHGEDQSVVVHGALSGWTLQRVLREKARELLGRNAGLSQFPLLVKYLDANDRLSLQVHPTDALARETNRGCNGKTEAWVILEAGPNSRIYAGLRAGVDREQLEASLRLGTVEECLHSFPARVGDCIFLPAGTLHAIGEGILLAEIQQTSDVTYRLYDWGRVGSDGKPRALHVEQSLECIDFARGPVNPVMPLQISSAPCLIEELVRCEHFILRRHALSEPALLEREDRFHILMAVAGEGHLECGGNRQQLAKGTTVLIPASSPEINLVPRGTLSLLETYLP